MNEKGQCKLQYYSVASTTCLAGARMKRHNSFNTIAIKVMMEMLTNVSNLYRVAEIELIYKMSHLNLLKSSRYCYWTMPATCFGIFEVSKGGISGASADVRIVFAAALKADVTRIMLAYNHHSGRLVPSDFDKYIT